MGCFQSICVFLEDSFAGILVSTTVIIDPLLVELMSALGHLARYSGFNMQPDWSRFPLVLCEGVVRWPNPREKYDHCILLQSGILAWKCSSSSFAQTTKLLSSQQAAQLHLVCLGACNKATHFCAFSFIAQIQYRNKLCRAPNCRLVHFFHFGALCWEAKLRNDTLPKILWQNLFFWYPVH